MDKAISNGAMLKELTKAQSLIEKNGQVTGVNVKDNSGHSYQLHAPMVVDASGRDFTFAQNKRKWKKRDPKLNKIALWTYYKGALRDPGLDAGSTTVAYLPGKGWFWYIPLEGDIVSVGIVGVKDYLYREGNDISILLVK